MKIFERKPSSGEIVFFIFSFSLLIGFYFNEDASGGGNSADFNNTWGYVLALKENLFVDSSIWTVHLPLHYVLLANLDFITNDKYLLRLVFCLISIAVPLLFYFNLKLKYGEIDKNVLLLLSSLIFIFPSYRYTAIWANGHITSFIFFLTSTLFYLRWINRGNFKNLNYNLILQVIFLSLAVYTRQYYALIFLYFMIVYFNKLKLTKFIILSIFIFFLSLPGFWLISQQSHTISPTLFSTNISNTLLINFSIISLYIAPIFFFVVINNKTIFRNETKKFAYITAFSTLLVCLLSIFFNYDHSLGGGFFIKLSNLFFNNNIIFYFSSILGSIFLFYISKENFENLLISSIMLLGFSFSIIYQKYFEPMFIFIFFLIMNSKIAMEFIKNQKNIIFFFIYLSIYLFSAILNDIFQITKSI